MTGGDIPKDSPAAGFVGSAPPVAARLKVMPASDPSAHLAQDRDGLLALLRRPCFAAPLVL